MSDITSVFDEESVVVEGTEDEKKKKLKKDLNKKIRDSLIKDINEDPGLADRLHALSKSVTVENTLGYEDDGGLVHDKSASAAQGKRVLPSTSSVVGYRVKNTGTEPIEYQDTAYKKNAEGIYEGTTVQRVLNPGATADMTRETLALMSLRPEISNVLANGIVKMSVPVDSNVKAALKKAHFQFNDDLGISVHDDGVKISIGGPGAIKEEFTEVFGFYNNPVEKSTKDTRGTSDKKKLTAQALTAHYMWKMINSDGQM